MWANNYIPLKAKLAALQDRQSADNHARPGGPQSPAHFSVQGTRASLEPLSSPLSPFQGRSRADAVPNLICTESITLNGVQTARAVQPILINERVTEPYENFLSRPTLTIRLTSQELCTVGFILVEAGVDDHTRWKFFDANSKPEDVGSLFTASPPSLTDDTGPQIILKFRLSFHPEGPFCQAPTQASTIPDHALPQSSFNWLPVRENCASAGSRTDWTGLVPRDQVRVALNALHDELERVDISEPLARKLNEEQCKLEQRAERSLYCARNTPEQSAYRSTSATLSYIDRWDCLHAAIRASMYQISVQSSTGRSGRLARIVSDACRDFARGVRSPTEWECDPESELQQE